MYLWAVILLIALLLILPSFFVIYSNFTTLYNASIVSIGTSMEPVISKNDIVFSQPITNPENISIGDYVIYQTDELAPEYVCHQVVSKYTDTVELQGINESESEVVPYENIRSNVFQIGSYPVKINARYVYFPSHTS